MVVLRRRGGISPDSVVDDFLPILASMSVMDLPERRGARPPATWTVTPGRVRPLSVLAMQTDDRAQERTAKISVRTLTAMVVGSMVGAGVFRCRPVRRRDRGASSPHLLDDRGQRHAHARLRVPAVRDARPDLDSGVYAYAKAGSRLSRLLLSVRVLDHACVGMSLPDHRDSRRLTALAGPALRRAAFAYPHHVGAEYGLTWRFAVDLNRRRAFHPAGIRLGSSVMHIVVTHFQLQMHMAGRILELDAEQWSAIRPALESSSVDHSRYRARPSAWAPPVPATLVSTSTQPHG